MKNINSSNTTKLLSVNEVKQQIDIRLNHFLSSQQKEAKKIDDYYGKMLDEIKVFIARGGKRMRPYLAYLSYVGSGGTQVDEFLDLAISIELLHNFLLIHDDIIDRDFQRYGGLNIAGTYKRQFDTWMNKEDASHMSGTAALLAGDINAMLCSERILQSDFDDSIKLKLIHDINYAIFTVGGGEYLDVLAPHLESVQEKYLEKIYEYKSAIYSIEMPLRFGAHAAGKSLTFDDYSRPIGIAFQLVDDLLGIYGDEKTTGKPILSDLHEGKKTVLFVRALSASDVQQKKVLENALGNTKTTLKDLDKVRKVIDQTGAHKYVQDKARNNLKAALQALEMIDLHSNSKEALRQLSQFIINRNF